MLTAIKSVNNTTFNDVMHVLKKLVEQDNFYVYNYESCAKVTNYNTIYQLIVTLYAIWYHLYNLKNVKNTHGGVLHLVKLQA